MPESVEVREMFNVWKKTSVQQSVLIILFIEFHSGVYNVYASAPEN